MVKTLGQNEPFMANSYGKNKKINNKIIKFML